MNSRFLVTKLLVPSSRERLVMRERLIEQINDGLNRGHRLTLIAAPAGFGKTTLVTQWLGYLPGVAWISLDEADNDPVYFFSLLIASLRQLHPSIGENAEQLLHLPEAPYQWICTALINDIVATGMEVRLVLDDYHLITEPVIHQAVGFFLDHQPPSVHAIITTRQEPPLPLGRMRVRSQITEIHLQDLRFTVEETTQFFEQALPFRLSTEAVEKLETQTEGWIGGLQLAAFALQNGHLDAETFVDQFAGSDRYVADYLIADVLHQQSDDIQQFLRQTSILDQIHASICNVLTGREDSQTILHHLETANVFLMPLDYQREWFRYNRLFAEFLRSTLEPAEEERLHLRAAQWYDTHGYIHQAIHHALAGDSLVDEAVRLILQSAESTLHSGRVATLANWLNMLPENLVYTNFNLAVYKGWISLLRGQTEAAEDYAKAASAAASTADVLDIEVGKLRVLRAYLALAKRDYPAVIAFAGEALRQLGNLQSPWRASALFVQSEAQERTANIADAIASLREARQLSSASNTPIFSAALDGSLAMALNEHGQRREASTILEQAINHYVAENGQPLAPTALIVGRLALLEYEANRIDRARQYYEQFEALHPSLSSVELGELAQGIQARILAAEGQIDSALELLAQVRLNASESRMADAGWLAADEVNIHLKQHDLAFAEQWAKNIHWSVNDKPQFIHIDEHLAYARYLLAADQLTAAKDWLQTLETFTRESGLQRRMLTIYLLQGLAAEKSGDHTHSREWLRLAIKLAALEDYVRAFLDEDAQLIGLLGSVRHLSPAFIDAILNAARGGKVEKQPQMLIEPLSDRELEVLGLISVGLSNPEIAQRLFIAEGTVKRHINNLYSKLDVRSRTQAVAKAHELKLIRH